MKSVTIFTLLSLFLVLNSCRKKCEGEILVCNEQPPIGQLCYAYYTRWFYDSSSKKCEEIGYSGCDQLGFSTEQECELCDCR